MGHLNAVTRTATDRARFAALDVLAALDASTASALEDLARLAGEACGTPIAAVRIAAETRQHLTVFYAPAVPTPSILEDAYCQFVIASRQPLVIVDTHRDARFRGARLRSEPVVRSYAGWPLITDEGLCVGTLSVIDYRTRRLGDVERSTLGRLASLAMHLRSEEHTSELQS